MGDTEIQHQRHRTRRIRKVSATSMSPQLWPRLLATCCVFTLCVVRKRSVSWSTAQSWAFLVPECVVQSQRWSSRAGTHGRDKESLSETIRLLRLKISHLRPKYRVLNGSHYALLWAQVNCSARHEPVNISLRSRKGWKWLRSFQKLILIDCVFFSYPFTNFFSKFFCWLKMWVNI